MHPSEGGPGFLRPDRAALQRALEVTHGVGSPREAWSLLSEAGLVAPPRPGFSRRMFTGVWRRMICEYSEPPELYEVPPTVHACLALAASPRELAAAEALAGILADRWQGWVDPTSEPWRLVWLVADPVALERAGEIDLGWFEDVTSAFYTQVPDVSEPNAWDESTHAWDESAHAPPPANLDALREQHLRLAKLFHESVEIAKSMLGVKLPPSPLEPVAELASFGFALGDVFTNGPWDPPTIVLLAPGIPEDPGVTDAERRHLWARCTNPLPLVEALAAGPARDELARTLLALCETAPWAEAYLANSQHSFGRGPAVVDGYDWRAGSAKIAAERAVWLRRVAQQLLDPPVDPPEPDSNSFATFWFNLHLRPEHAAPLAALFCETLRACWPEPPPTASLDALRRYVRI